MNFKKLGSLFGGIIVLSFLVWIVPAITVVVWDLVSSTFLTEIVSAGYLPSSITWAQAFAICVFFLAINGYNILFSGTKD